MFSNWLRSRISGKRRDETGVIENKIEREMREVPEDLVPIFASLDMSPEDPMYNSHTAEILKKYGERAVNVLKQVPIKARKNNHGFIWVCIREYGPELVSEVIAEEKLLDDNARRFDLLRDYCKLWGDLKQLGEPEKEIVQYNLNFSGYVQDVGFRGTTRIYAYILGLVGYVKNLDDGSVECVIRGPESRIKVLKSALNREFEIRGVRESKIQVQYMLERFEVL